MAGIMPKKLQKCFAKLLEEKWQFLDQPWPMCPKTKKFHRSEMKPIQNSQRMRDLLMHRLGAIPVFFFLTVIWPKFYFPGPYRAVDKGIAFLYYFVAGQTMDSMSQFMPRTSFHQVYTTFFKTEKALFDKYITECLSTMFSTPEIREIWIKDTAWKDEGFDYPTDKKLIPDVTETYTVLNKLEYGHEMLKAQEAFLGMDITEDNEMEEVHRNSCTIVECVQIPQRRKK
ncbi:MAG: hypothetical protein BYD32DRAFT_439156 [Podila humilis]|nr:MAG: hypothetical protein BYD32DRAFT_439156 [Podila humilis]